MEPIISPWLIYIVDVASTIKLVAMIVVLLGIVAVLLFPILADIVDAQEETLVKYKKLLCVVIIIALLLLIFIPAKTTLLAMLVLQYTTPDNISLVQNNIVDFIQKVVEASREVK